MALRLALRRSPCSPLISTTTAVAALGAAPSASAAVAAIGAPLCSFSDKPSNKPSAIIDSLLDLYSPSKTSQAAGAGTSSPFRRSAPLKVDQNALLGELSPLGSGRRQDASSRFPGTSNFNNFNNRMPFNASKEFGDTLASIQKFPNPHIVHVTASRNNTICTLTNSAGKTLCWSSAGTCGLRKAARGTSDAGYQAILSLTEKAKSKQIATHFGVHLRLAGFGPGREQAFRAIRAAGWNITRITDYTAYRHAGCRPRKKRRL